MYSRSEQQLRFIFTRYGTDRNSDRSFFTRFDLDRNADFFSIFFDPEPQFGIIQTFFVAPRDAIRFYPTGAFARTTARIVIIVFNSPSAVGAAMYFISTAAFILHVYRLVVYSGISPSACTDFARAPCRKLLFYSRPWSLALNSLNRREGSVDHVVLRRVTAARESRSSCGRVCGPSPRSPLLCERWQKICEKNGRVRIAGKN